MGKITLYIVDDHNTFAESLKVLLHTNPKFQVVGVSEDPREAIQKIIAQKPDIVLTDISMEFIDGIELIKQVRSQTSLIDFIALSMHKEERTIKRAIKAGASAYLLKNTKKEELFTAIEEVFKGNKYVPNEVKNIIAESAFQNIEKPLGTSGTPEISEREKEILVSIANGLTIQEIAKKHGISPNTVLFHRKNLFEKFGVKASAAMVAAAYEYGIL